MQSAAKKAAAKEATPATKTKDPAKADAKTKDAATADDPKTEATEKAEVTEKAEPEKKAVDEPAVKAGRKNSVSSSSTLVLSKPETIVVSNARSSPATCTGSIQIWQLKNDVVSERACPL